MFWRLELLLQQNLRGEDNTYTGIAQTLGFKGAYSITKGIIVMSVGEWGMIRDMKAEVRYENQKTNYLILLTSHLICEESV